MVYSWRQWHGDDYSDYDYDHDYDYDYDYDEDGKEGDDVIIIFTFSV